MMSCFVLVMPVRFVKDRSLLFRLHTLMFTMNSLKLVMWNVRGLCAKPKCGAILSHLKSLKAVVSVPNWSKKIPAELPS